MPSIASRTSSGELGLLTLIWGLLTLIANFDLGLGKAVGLAVAGSSDNWTSARTAALRAGFLSQTPLALGTAATTFVLLRTDPSFTNESSHWPYVLCSLSLFAVAWASTARWALEACGGVKASASIAGAGGIAQFTLPALCLWLGISFTTSVTVMLAARAAIGVVGIRLILRLAHPRPDGRMVVRAVRPLWSVGVWVAATSITSAISNYGDRLAALRFFDAGQLSGYTLPFEFLLRIAIVPAIVVRLAFAEINLMRGNEGRIRTAVDKTSNQLLIVPVGAALTMVLLPALAESWLGDDLPGALVPIGRILCIGIGMTGFLYLANDVLISLGRARKAALISIGSTGITAMGVFLAGWQADLRLLAAGWSAKVTVDALLTMAAVSRELNLAYWRRMVPAGCATALLALLAVI